MKAARLLAGAAAMVVAAGCAGATGPAARGRAGGSDAATASRWRVVSYRGVHVAVPAAWPVVSGMHTSFCGSPFPAAAAAFVGPNENGPPSCPDPGPVVARDGVWLRPGVPPRGARPVAITGRAVVLEQPHSVRDDIEAFWYHRVEVEVGIGSDPRTAAAILRSVGYTAGEPDSRAARACARSARAGSMPAPRRLGRRLVLDRLGASLDPPRPGDRAATPAARAWRSSGHKSPYTKYRVILARYSGAVPARLNANGTLTRQYRGVLAWVIYGQPRTPIAGCAGWSLDAFSARTGREMVFTGA